MNFNIIIVCESILKSKCQNSKHVIINSNFIPFRVQSFPLFQNSKVFERETILLFFALRHKLTKIAVNDLFLSLDKLTAFVYHVINTDNKTIAQFK